MTTDRPGFALMAVIATLVLVEVAILGAVSVCVRANITARESVQLARVRMAAGSAIRFAVAEWDELGVRFPGAGSVVAIPWVPTGSTAGIQYSVVAERTFRGVYLLRAEASFVAGARLRARSTAVATVSSIPTGEVWLDFHSAFTSGGDLELVASAAIDGGTPAGLPFPWTAADCVPAGPGGAHLSGSPRTGVALAAGAGLTTASTVSVTGSPAIWKGAPRTNAADFTRWAGLPLGDLLSVADHVISGSAAPGPASLSGVCDTSDPMNWGAPGNRADPCFDYFPLIFADGDLGVAAGEGQGVLIVKGNLTLAAGVRFHGPILVTGHIRADAVEIHGAVRAGGGSSFAGRVRFDQCALLRSLERSPPLRKVYRTGRRWWLPPF